MKTKVSETKPAPPQPTVSKNRRISTVWIIPILGLLLGTWLIIKHYGDKGPLIQVTFDDANGIISEKTEIRCSSVIIGKVEVVTLNDDLDVIIEMRIGKEFGHLIRQESRFWVVRPRISGSSITGLGTILSGSYIALDPGPKNGSRQNEFIGLEEPPVTPSSIPGLRLNLTSELPGTIDLGSKLYCQGNPIGKIESRHFDPTTRMTVFGVFIEEKFTNLVNSRTKFWRDNGLELDVGANGFKLDLPSIDSLISGRVNLKSPPNDETATALENGVSFALFNEKAAAEASTFDYAEQFLLLVNQSVRGLSKSAPVEFRGLRIGRVKEISYDLIKDTSTNKIPILIQLDNKLLAKHFPLGIKDAEAGYLVKETKNGLRATLKSSSLLTGQLVVDLDYYSDLPAEPITELEGYKLLPSAESGLARMEDRLAAVLNKINNLPIENLLQDLQKTSQEGTAAISKIRLMLDEEDGLIAQTQQTMSEAKVTLVALKKLLDNEDMNEIPADFRESLKSLQTILNNKDMKQIPHDIRNTLNELKLAVKPFSPDGNVHGDLLRTLEEIRATVRSLERTSKTIGDKPNSLLFGKDKSSKATPKAKQ